jgi:hypothetical protein
MKTRNSEECFEQNNKTKIQSLFLDKDFWYKSKTSKNKSKIYLLPFKVESCNDIIFIDFNIKLSTVDILTLPLILTWDQMKMIL